MATTAFCDWCGELMKVPEGEKPAALLASGHGGGEGRSSLFWQNVAGFNIHCELHGGRVDPDCCLGKLETLLRERAEWAHDPDQENLEWRLVTREGRTPTFRERQSQELSAEDERWHRWGQLSTEQRMEMVRAQLTERLTVREIAEKIETDNPDMTVYEQRVRPLVTRLFKAGELVREPEEWRENQTRYRYTLSTKGGVGMMQLLQGEFR